MFHYLSFILILLIATPLNAQEDLLSQSNVRTALKYIEENYNRYLQKQIRIAEIPAPPFKETVRAKFIASEFKHLGLKNVSIDAEGNVLGWRHGRGAHTLAISAHLDTVFPEGTDVKVKREGNRYLGPGLVDDSLGLMNLLALIETLNKAKIQTENTLLFIGTVGEEGLGDLRGVKYLFNEGKYRHDINAFISIDGAGTGHITNGALGSKRYRVTITGPGGHSYGRFGRVNPAHAMGQIIARFTIMGVPKDPKTTYNVGRIGGGTSVNSIPFENWMEVDMRSESNEELLKLEQLFLQTVKQGIDAENLYRAASETELQVKTERIGDRPSGKTAVDTDIVKAAQWATKAIGDTPVFRISSTDANIPISMGIPAIGIGGGGKSKNAHSLHEWFEPEQAYKGIQRNLLLILKYDQLTNSDP